MRNLIIGTMCLALLIGMFDKAVVYGNEESATVPGPVITLIEEYKEYLATPKSTFLYYCSPCHGPNADGKGIYFTIDLEPRPTNLTDVEYMAQLTDDYLLDFISKGSAAMEKSELCPPWGNTFEEDRIKGIISYLRGLTISKTKKEAGPEAKKEEGADVKAPEGKKKGTPKSIIILVLILICAVVIFGAVHEWKKLEKEEASKE